MEIVLNVITLAEYWLLADASSRKVHFKSLQGRLVVEAVLAPRGMVEVLHRGFLGVGKSGARAITNFLHRNYSTYPA